MVAFDFFENLFENSANISDLSFEISGFVRMNKG